MPTKTRTSRRTRRPKPSKQPRIRKILIVDDDEMVRKACARSLGRELEVFTAPDGESAKRIARNELPDLAIVDLALGNESGIDVVVALKAHDPSLIVVLISGYLSTSVTVLAIQSGAQLVLAKPISAKEILRRVETGSPEPMKLEMRKSLARVEWEHVQGVIADCNGNITRAAQRLGVFRSTVQRILRRPEPKA